ncbi:helix-turn-helix transcriptional regulator [Aquamicrobium sp. NLF2-7]|uniref:winged helix-turn-helix transcriptional regulator n=1 Tax=Aquamicrobium sp. NLF2-7 TaxID=2918753 RepID=UPI001EFAE139|nr:helix-turn-helix domain-containing protein [Aquamicrobium sp. NLF2-7]MCG8273874.1 helix-turn-helix transcriptional regulator [Aquamicrobium sp. NLF2-7]
MRLGNVDIPRETCQLVGNILGHVGDKWSVLIIVLLRERSMRYSELERQIETVSKKMLTSTLRNLERDGFISRTVTASIPPRVDYKLTDLGREVMEPLDVLARWALTNSQRIVLARSHYDALRD